MKKILSVTLITSLAFSTMGARPLTPADNTGNTQRIHVVNETVENNEQHEEAASSITKSALCGAIAGVIMYAIMRCPLPIKNSDQEATGRFLAGTATVIGTALKINHLVKSKGKNSDQDKKTAQRYALATGLLATGFCIWLDSIIIG